MTYCIDNPIGKSSTSTTLDTPKTDSIPQWMKPVIKPPTTVTGVIKKVVKDVLCPIRAFPNSFDTISNVPRHYTISLDPYNQDCLACLPESAHRIQDKD